MTVELPRRGDYIQTFDSINQVAEHPDASGLLSNALFGVALLTATHLSYFSTKGLVVCGDVIANDQS